MRKFIYILFLLFASTTMHAQSLNYKLYADMFNYFHLDTGDSLTFWGYGYYFSPTNKLPTTLPAPLLKSNKDQDVSIRFYNLSPEDHTIHLHGLDVDTRNDGVPHTWFAVDPNDSIVYSYNSPYPGTYLYHCHVMTVHHLAMGMYGMISVRNYPDTTRLYDGGPGFNKEYFYLFSDADTNWNANPTSPGHLHDYHSNYYMVNGLSSWQLFNGTSNVIQANAGDSVAVHFGNIGYTSVQLDFPPQMNAKIYQSDGRVLPSPIVSNSLRLYPGERYEVVFKPATFYTGYIDVTHHDAVMDHEKGINYIGINSLTHPNGIDEVVNNSTSLLNAYPNPTSGTVNFTVEKEDMIYLSDAKGNIVLRQLVKPGATEINVKHLNNGLYLLQVNGKTAKLMVQH